MKKLVSAVCVSSLILGACSQVTTSAQTMPSEANNTGVEEVAEVNGPSIVEMKKLLWEVAVEKGIPPEILKAVAQTESAMKQFNADGSPFISPDGGIGLMQITLTTAQIDQGLYDMERLKIDTRYNIEVGADILLEKKSFDLPLINENDPTTIESWYFAVMAYNGLSKRNDPQEGKSAYQERVFDEIRNRSGLYLLETPAVEINYPDPDRPELMSFPDKSYQWDGMSTQSTQLLSKGDTAYTYNHVYTYSNMRDAADGEVSGKALHYTPLQIVDGPFESTNEANHYVFYQVKGNGIEGFISSGNLIKGDVMIFPDIEDPDTAAAVAFLQQRQIINGYPDGTFKPTNQLTRGQAAAMLTRALDLPLPEGYVMKATDMSQGSDYYDEMLLMEAHGLMGKGGELRPNESLKRAQIASILARAYDHVYGEAATNIDFSDVNEAEEAYASINLLANNDIVDAGAFRPWENVTRAEFSLFVKRTIEKEERK
ncbi:S-layer homology domain-containing protein [Cytobacillus sp. Hm23]